MEPQRCIGTEHSLEGFDTYTRAAGEGKLESVISLIDKGADVGQTDFGGETALHWFVHSFIVTLCRAALNGHVHVTLHLS